MDEALSRVVDFPAARGWSFLNAVQSGIIGAFDTQLAYEVFQGFANHAFVTLHIDNLRENFTTRPKPCSGVCPRAAWAWRSTPAPRA
jgi:imidazoleglycerol phosphate dehydratase HisB